MSGSGIFDQAWGDVYGQWDSAGLELNLLFREERSLARWSAIRHIRFKGKWKVERMSVLNGTLTEHQGRMRDQPFDLVLIEHKKSKMGDEDGKMKKESIFTENMKKYLQNASKENIFFDFKIVSNDGSIIESNKIILASQSEYFEKMFKKECRDSTRLEFSADVVRQVITFLYTQVNSQSPRHQSLPK